MTQAKDSIVKTEGGGEMSTGDLPQCPICGLFIYPQFPHAHSKDEMAPFFNRVADLARKPLDEIMEKRKEGPTGLMLD